MVAKQVLRQVNFVPIFADFWDNYRFQNLSLRIRWQYDMLVRQFLHQSQLPRTSESSVYRLHSIVEDENVGYNDENCSTVPMIVDNYFV